MLAGELIVVRKDMVGQRTGVHNGENRTCVEDKQIGT